MPRMGRVVLPNAPHPIMQRGHNRQVVFVQRKVYERYQAFIAQAVDTLDWQAIRSALQRGQLTGSTRFIEEVEQLIGKCIEVRAQGRPRGRK